MGKLVGACIKKARKKKRLTQQELADKIEKSKSTIQKYEAGTVQLSVNEMTKIASALDMSLTALLSINDKPAYETLIDSFPETKSDRINDLFDQLNDMGKDKVIDYTKDLVRIPEYRQDQAGPQPQFYMKPVENEESQTGK